METQTCKFCDGDGCCACDHYGYIDRESPMWGAEPIDDEDSESP